LGLGSLEALTLARTEGQFEASLAVFNALLKTRHLTIEHVERADALGRHVLERLGPLVLVYARPLIALDGVALRADLRVAAMWAGAALADGPWRFRCGTVSTERSVRG
jgi:hypothetical protein